MNRRLPDARLKLIYRWEATVGDLQTSVEIETGGESLDLFNKGMLIGLQGRQPAGMIDEVYLVG